MSAACSRMFERKRESVSEFHTIGADIRKFRSPNFVRVRGITRSLRVAECRLVRPGSCTHWSANVTEIGRADVVNTVPSQDGDFVADLLLYIAPVEDWGDVADHPSINNESHSSVQNHLKSLNFFFSDSV